MQIEVNGARLWFDVAGPALVPDGAMMRPRPTLVLVHGGPGSYDHSYFKPHFAPLVDVAQLVYVDLRNHGRSSRHEPADWSFERCADDLRAFLDALGIERPVVLGHSMGGFVAMLYGACYPGHAAGLILQSTLARFDLDRLVEGVRTLSDDETAAIARRSYGGEEVSADEWGRVFATFGPTVPSADELARRIRNPDVGVRGMGLLRTFDARDVLGAIDCPTLVCTGDRDGVMPLSTAHELLEALPAGRARLAVVEGAGHFPWLDAPERYLSLIRSFIREVGELRSPTRTAPSPSAS